MSKFIYTAVTFYVTLIVFLGVAGATIGDASTYVEFPERPTLKQAQETLSGIGGLSYLLAIPFLIIEFFAWILLVLFFILQLVTFSLFVFFPAWLNTIIFLPLGITVIYVAIRELVRGGGASG